MSALVLYLGNSQFIEIDGVKDQSTSPSTYLDTGVATGTLYDPTGNPVLGAENVVGVYQISSNGNYRFPMDPSQFNQASQPNLPLGGGYTFKVDITSNTIKYHIELACSVKVRKTGLET